MTSADGGSPAPRLVSPQSECATLGARLLCCACRFARRAVARISLALRQSAVTMSVLIETNQFDPRERSDVLQAVLTRATAPNALRLLGPPGKVHARLEHWQLSPDVTILQQASSGISHTRTPAHGRHGGPERVVFVLHNGGPGSYVHDDTR